LPRLTPFVAHFPALTEALTYKDVPSSARIPKQPQPPALPTLHTPWSAERHPMLCFCLCLCLCCHVRATKQSKLPLQPAEEVDYCWPATKENLPASPWSTYLPNQPPRSCDASVCVCRKFRFMRETNRTLLCGARMCVCVAIRACADIRWLACLAGWLVACLVCALRLCDEPLSTLMHPRSIYGFITQQQRTAAHPQEFTFYVLHMCANCEVVDEGWAVSEAVGQRMRYPSLLTSSRLCAAK